MVASARVAHLARRAGDYGVQTGDVSVDYHKVRERKNNIVKQFRDGGKKGLENEDGIDLLRGTARFSGEKTVEIRGTEGQTRDLSAPLIFINTGQRPRIPDIENLETVPYYTSRSLLELEEQPDHLIIIGAGYIGLEFGQMYARMGSEVTILQRNNRIIPQEDPDITAELTEILREDGVDVRTGVSIQAVHQKKNDFISVTGHRNQENIEVSGSHVLVATGRTPNTEDLQLEQAGIDTDDRGYINVDHKLQTAVEGIYALGDVKGGPQFTHVSYDDYRIVRDNLLTDRERSTKGRPVPYTLFTDPELGRIGLNEKTAREKEIPYRLAKMPMSHIARALETGETRGLMKVLVDTQTDQILGASILGHGGGDIATSLQIAMMGTVPYTELQNAIFSHPVWLESLNNLFENLTDPGA